MVKQEEETSTTTTENPRNGGKQKVTNDNDDGNRIIVLVDMDGVMCDFDLAINKTYKTLYPGEPVLDMETERKYFYMQQNYYEKFGEIAKDRVKEIQESEGFFENLPPIRGSIQGVLKLDSHPRVDVLICTSPLTEYKFVLREKYAWIERHLGREWVKRIVLTKDKTVVDGRVLIDDRPEITGIRDKPYWEHILFDQPYNRSIQNKRRLTCWSQVDDLLASLLE